MLSSAEFYVFMAKRIKKRRKNFIKKVRLVKDVKKISRVTDRIIRTERDVMYFTPQDLLRIIKESDKNGLKRITVVYEIEIENEWMMIKMYDNTHDTSQLHRHTRTSIQNPHHIIDLQSVVKRGDIWHWLDWARGDIIKKFWYMRRAFEKRSRVVDN